MHKSLADRIEECGVVSIIRGTDPAKIIPTVQAVYDGGIRAVEITMNTEGAFEMIKAARKEFSGRMLIGAGTVLDEQAARMSIAAGCDFLLSPTLDAGVIRLANAYSVLAIPGVMTPTEALEGWKAGAGFIKIFPAGVLGPGYIKAVKGPLPQLRLMPVGGVNLENAGEFIRCGADALGIGGELVNKKRVEAGAFEEIRSLAAAYLEAVQKARA
ncbi:MAG: bifunctional 4-hydroxy-2-oxoglutarate aldolase/2-dehydro-3-deoxy-phosphogluconate aldolase [Provencibacterium sp.]|jgi:2-dehydro-3-deoxyphosphogluconate aldolase/(4S)-4-hydroxy-2-oxoglutarate aldolase|nr:bifunctional 4-hydroxy-2-oxoglutarate aldolase/2-dehydro-3-deoxy-phosphogluconate aldolase [Provencibacterium sp.]